MIQNPFIYNAPVRGEDFFNRKKIIEDLLKQTVTGKSQGNVWVIGGRQIGKTSLLRYIQNTYEDYNKKIQLYGTQEEFNVAFIYTNCQNFKNDNDFYGNLYQSMKNYFDFKIEKGDDAYKDFINALHYVYSQFFYIVFLLDEFDAFIQNLIKTDAAHFLGALNKLVNGISEIKNEPKVFGCIFTANHSIEELTTDIEITGSGLIIESMELPLFSRDQVEELAMHYLAESPDFFSKQEIEFCYKMACGYPYFTQKLFSLMFDEENKNANGKYLSKVKKEYGKIFQATVKNWGGSKMPESTSDKIREVLKISSELGIKILKELIMNL
ncbi:MAG: hypothetical protein GY795_04820 [Desulfobacterales bacterium]|nr:hypothetical protein [Desulfobacterales bacterium]